MYQRAGGGFHIQNNQTGGQRSLGTNDKAAAQRLLEAENQVCQSAALNLELGKVYLRNADPTLATRTWREVMDELSTHGKATSQNRYQRGMKAKEFDLIRNKAAGGNLIPPLD